MFLKNVFKGCYVINSFLLLFTAKYLSTAMKYKLLFLKLPIQIPLKLLLLHCIMGSMI